MASAACSLVTSLSPAERAFTRVLRRWLKAARTTWKNRFSLFTATGGTFRTFRCTTLLVTFGAGNIDRFIGPITDMLEKRL